MRDLVPTEIPDGWREWNEVDRLKYELRQAIWTTEFLHDCLTKPNFKYAYPSQTLFYLERWRKLIKDAPECTAGMFSSKHPPGICPVHHRLMPIEGD